jgi:hypothetical protein
MRNVRDAQRASFMESSRFRSYSADRHARQLHRRRTAKTALVWLSAFAAAWIVLESAKAVTLF